MTSLTRGPLPARVYWTRRVVVLAAALLLVVGIARVLTLGSDGSSPSPRAVQAGAESTSSSSPAPTTDETTTTDATEGARGPRPQRPSRQPVLLAEPDGPCAEDDITVTPRVKRSVAGPHGEVLIVLALRTLESEACTWRVARDTLTVKISSGDDDIWSSRQCPRAVPTRSVTVRDNVSTTVGLTWNGRRSDAGCSRLTEWALPGYYHVTAAALAGEPADEQFELTAPRAPVVTTSPSPSGKPHGARNSGRPDTSPSGAVEPSTEPTSGPTSGPSAR